MLLIHSIKFRDIYYFVNLYAGMKNITHSQHKNYNNVVLVVELRNYAGKHVLNKKLSKMQFNMPNVLFILVAYLQAGPTITNPYTTQIVLILTALPHVNLYGIIQNFLKWICALIDVLEINLVGHHACLRINNKMLINVSNVLNKIIVSRFLMYDFDLMQKYILSILNIILWVI